MFYWKLTKSVQSIELDMFAKRSILCYNFTVRLTTWNILIVDWIRKKLCSIIMLLNYVPHTCVHLDVKTDFCSDEINIRNFHNSPSVNMDKLWNLCCEYWLCTLDERTTTVCFTITIGQFVSRNTFFLSTTFNHIS